MFNQVKYGDIYVCIQWYTMLLAECYYNSLVCCNHWSYFPDVCTVYRRQRADTSICVSATSTILKFKMTLSKHLSTAASLVTLLCGGISQKSNNEWPQYRYADSHWDWPNYIWWDARTTKLYSEQSGEDHGCNSIKQLIFISSSTCAMWGLTHEFYNNCYK